MGFCLCDTSPCAQEVCVCGQGGETEALARLAESLSDKAWVAAFEKPKGDPTAFIKPATTVLSPHLKFGCLSPRLFYQALQRVRSPPSAHPMCNPPQNSV